MHTIKTLFQNLKDYSDITDYENYKINYKNTYAHYKNFVSKSERLF